MTAKVATAAKSTPRAAPRGAHESARHAFRQSLLEEAERVFARTGFQATKMTEVARAAGVAVGTIYNHFKSKEEIFEAVVLSRSAEFRGELEPLLRIESPIERLRTIWDASFTHLGTHSALFMLFIERGGVSELDVERLGGVCVKQEYDVFLARLREVVTAAVKAKQLRADVPVDTMVATLSGAMNGAFYAWVKRQRRGRIEDVAEDLWKLFFSGARPPR